MKLPAFDKTLHFAAGAIAAAAGAAAGAIAFLLIPAMEPAYIAMVAMAACAAAALLREAYNLQQGGLFDWRDVLATMLGSVPVLVGVLAGGCA